MYGREAYLEIEADELEREIRALLEAADDGVAEVVRRRWKARWESVRRAVRGW